MNENKIYIYICFKKNLENSFKRRDRKKRERERVNLILETSTSKTVDPDAVDTVVVKITIKMNETEWRLFKFD